MTAGPGTGVPVYRGVVVDPDEPTSDSNGVEVLEGVLYNEVDRLARDHLSPAKAKARKFATLGEVVDQIVGEPESVGGLRDGQHQALGRPCGSAEWVVWLGG